MKVEQAWGKRTEVEEARGKGEGGWGEGEGGICEVPQFQSLGEGGMGSFAL